jgi:GTP-dependent dephospho-CoA kinase
VSSDERVWVVPASLRPALSRRYGVVLAGTAAEERIRTLRQFASCGDRVTALAIGTGNLPLVGIVDYKTQRNEPVDPRSFEPLRARRLVRVRNPPGTLTGALRDAVRDLVRSGGGLLEVDGEEDLGSLALVEAMPSGATVIYGLPGEGVSFVPVDAVTQEHVRELIAQMELREVRHGS